MPYHTIPCVCGCAQGKQVGGGVAVFRRGGGGCWRRGGVEEWKLWVFKDEIDDVVIWKYHFS